MATNEEWQAARSAVCDAIFNLQVSRGMGAARDQFIGLSDDALIVAAQVSWKSYLIAASVLSARNGAQAVFDALADA
jgi:hypothetical protein